MKVCAMFYEAPAQAVMFFGSETWVMTPVLLCGCPSYDGHFATHEARRVCGRAAGLFRLGEGAEGSRPAHDCLLRGHLARHRPEVRLRAPNLRALHRGKPKARRTGRKTFWFEQEMDLEEDKASPATATADGGLDFQ